MSEEYIISEESDSISKKADYEETADPDFSKDSDDLELPKPSSNISLSKGDNIIISSFVCLYYIRFFWKIYRR